MKLNLDKRYAKICKYVILTAVVIYLLFNVIDSIPSAYDTLLKVLSTIYDISTPAIMGLIMAYLFFGPMNAIETFLMKRKYFPKNKMLCRSIGLFTSYIGILGAIVLIFIGIYFMIGGQLSEYSTFSNIYSYIMNYFDSNSISPETIQQFIMEKNIPFGDIINDKLSNIAAFVQDVLSGVFAGLANFLISLGGNIFSMLLSLILSIYLLLSHEYFTDLWNKFFFIIFRKTKGGLVLKRALHTINYTFSKYIRGQLIEACIVAIMSIIVLSIVGVDYAVIIGIISGVCNLIPYVGPFVGIVLAAIMALFSGNLFMIVGAVIGLLIVQQIDSNIIAPKIVGDIVGLHPAFIIVALTIGGNLYGLLGMLIAVPVAASIKNLISDWFEYYIKDKYEIYESDSSFEKMDRNTLVSAFTGNEKTDKNQKKNEDKEKDENAE